MRVRRCSNPESGGVGELLELEKIHDDAIFLRQG